MGLTWKFHALTRRHDKMVEKWWFKQARIGLPLRLQLITSGKSYYSVDKMALKLNELSDRYCHCYSSRADRSCSFTITVLYSCFSERKSQRIRILKLISVEYNTVDRYMSLVQESRIYYYGFLILSYLLLTIIGYISIIFKQYDRYINLLYL